MIYCLEIGTAKRRFLCINYISVHIEIEIKYLISFNRCIADKAPLIIIIVKSCSEYRSSMAEGGAYRVSRDWLTGLPVKWQETCQAGCGD